MTFGAILVAVSVAVMVDVLVAAVLVAVFGCRLLRISKKRETSCIDFPSTNFKKAQKRVTKISSMSFYRLVGNRTS